jgi:integrase
MVQTVGSWPFPAANSLSRVDQLNAVCDAKLVKYFGADRRIDNITVGEAKDWRIWLLDHLAEETTNRTCAYAIQFFNDAVDRELISKNPFAKLSAQPKGNPDRYYFLKPADAEKVLAACPTNEWKLIFALCRWGGLRCPSELVRLRWCDVNFETGRMNVHNQKTKRHKKLTRQVPIFVELRPCLEKMRAMNPDDFWVVPKVRNPNANLRSQLERFIKRAGLKPWEKLFQNLRSTRETELYEIYPSHVVCDWLGNSKRVADRHYNQITEDHFKRANGGGESATLVPPQLTAPQCDDSQKPQKNAEFVANWVKTAVHPLLENGRYKT